MVLTLPSMVSTGQAELLVTVELLDQERETVRATALDQFLALAQSSRFAGPYPTRDELHERH